MSSAPKLLALGLLTLSLSPAAVLQSLGNDLTRGNNDVPLIAGGLENGGFAGVLNFNVDGNPLAFAFCLDIFTAAGDMTSNAIAPFDADTRRVAWLLENAFPLITTAAQYAGMQVAIWEIMHDSTDDLLAGTIQRVVSPHPANGTPAYEAVITAATGYLSSSAGQSSNNAAIYIDPLGASQSIITAVPEPGTIGLMGLALVGLGMWRSKKS